MTDEHGKSTLPDSDLVEVDSQPSIPGIKWDPIVGPEADSLINRTNLTEPEKTTLLTESTDILGRCIPPSTRGRSTGLIIGHIQSGKTLSLTTVTALARDNLFQLIIIITGTINLLNNQSVRRIYEELRLNARHDYAWKTYRNPSPVHVQDIRDVLSDWHRDTTGVLKPQTVLITVLKHHSRLEKLADLLERATLTKTPALVIDDESDQASLNTMAGQPDNDRSTTNREIERIRQALDSHTYLGYTATPQAPLLINMIDTLSPEFAKVLTPGEKYVGGARLTSQRPSLVLAIPNSQLSNRSHEPPQSLLEAMRIFFLGVADGMIQGPTGNRSMLIHPSARTEDHQRYHQWVTIIKSSWHEILNDTATSSDRSELLRDFRQNHENLSITQPNLQTFETLVTQLPQAIRRTSLQQLNSSVPDEVGENIDEFWGRSYSNILVGGQKLERGFTIEGLTVTYMPRQIGGGQADTIQQRARFYGYNGSQLGLCRVYLGSAVRDAYIAYVEHEEQLRESLKEFSLTGRPLREWRRIFFLDARLKPTRDNVLDIDYTRGPEAGRWYYPLPPIGDINLVKCNRSAVTNLRSILDLAADKGDERRTEAQRHLVDHSVSLKELLARLLVPWHLATADDSRDFMAILLTLQHSIETLGDQLCSVYMMSSNRPQGRSLSKGRIEPFQGRNASTGYPGDRRLIHEGQLSIQIHHYPSVLHCSRTIAEDVDHLCIHLPNRLVRSMVVQSQGQGAL